MTAHFSSKRVMNNTALTVVAVVNIKIHLLENIIDLLIYNERFKKKLYSFSWLLILYQMLDFKHFHG